MELVAEAAAEPEAEPVEPDAAADEAFEVEPDEEALVALEEEAAVVLALLLPLDEPETTPVVPAPARARLEIPEGLSVRARVQCNGTHRYRCWSR